MPNSSTRQSSMVDVTDDDVDCIGDDTPTSLLTGASLGGGVIVNSAGTLAGARVGGGLP